MTVGAHSHGVVRSPRRRCWTVRRISFLLARLWAKMTTLGYFHSSMPIPAFEAIVHHASDNRTFRVALVMTTGRRVRPR